MKTFQLKPYYSLLLLFFLFSIAITHSHLSPLSTHTSPSSRSLLSSAAPSEDKKTLVAFQDGTLVLVKESGEVLGLFPTGDSASSLYQAESNTLLLEGVSEQVTELDLDDKHKLYVEDGFVTTLESGEKCLMQKVEDYFKDAPYISTDRIVLAEKKITILTIDIRSGKLIDVYALGKNALSDGNANKVDVADLLHIKRTDFSVLCFSRNPRKLRWSSTFFGVQISCPDQEGEHQVNVVHRRDANLVHFLNNISRLEGRTAKLFENPESNKYSVSLLNARNRGQSVNTPSWFEVASLWVCLVLAIVILGFILVRAGIIQITWQKSVVEVNGLSEESNIASKRKKCRKSSNSRNVANTKTIAKSMLFSDVEKFNGLPSDKRNVKEPWSSLGRPVDADVNGRIVGKVFISSKEIGKGSNGTIVMEGICDGRPVAVKRLVQAHHDIAHKEIQNLIASDQHPNIIRWYGVEYDSDFVYLSLERCDCSLADLIKTCSDSLRDTVTTQGKTSNSTKEWCVKVDIAKGINKHVELWKANGYPSPQLLRLMRDIVSGLVHLHELRIIHRDLKPQNILIINEKSLCAKLSDMGISKRLLEHKSSLGCHPTGYGSSGWQAPEQLLHGRQTRSVDLFGLGCVLFFCITGGKHPYGAHLERDINIVKNQLDLSMVEHIPEASDIIFHLLDPTPELRPTALSVLHHPLFWSSETRLSFLRDTSDRVELEGREIKSVLLTGLETVGPLALGGNWDEKMEASFIDNIGRYRRYKFDSTRDLLRVIRNKMNHYRELPKEIQEILGPVPEGFDAYFSSRFPKFLIEVYHVIYRYCREEECFQKYFRTV